MAWLDHEWSSEYLRARRARLGLDRAQLRRRRRADGVSHARARTAPRYGRAAALRDAARRRRACSARPTCASRRRGGGARRARASSIRWRCASRPAALDLALVPLMDDQELDSRASVGTVYWEGAVRAHRGRPRRRARLSRAHRVRRPLKLERICTGSEVRAALEVAHAALEVEDVLRLARDTLRAPSCRWR